MIRIRAEVANELRTWNVVVTIADLTIDDWNNAATFEDGVDLDRVVRDMIREVEPMAYIHHYELVTEEYRIHPTRPGSYRPGSLYDDGALDEEV